MNNLEKKTVKKNVALEKVWFNCKNKIANSINSSEKEAWLDSINLIELGIKLGRLKTGTTPRLDKNTIDFEKLQIQKGDKEISKFSFWNSQVCLPQLPCYITYTNKKTHKIIADNIQFSSVYNGKHTK